MPSPAGALALLALGRSMRGRGFSLHLVVALRLFRDINFYGRQGEAGLVTTASGTGLSTAGAHVRKGVSGAAAASVAGHLRGEENLGERANWLRLERGFSAFLRWAELQSTGRATCSPLRAKTSCRPSTGTHRARWRLCITRPVRARAKGRARASGTCEHVFRTHHRQVGQEARHLHGSDRDGCTTPRRARRGRAAPEIGSREMPRARAVVPARAYAPRAQRVAHRAGPTRGRRTAARRGARDLGAPRGEALARACGAVSAAAADRGCDLITASEGACRSSAKSRQSSDRSSGASARVCSASASSPRSWSPPR